MNAITQLLRALAIVLVLGCVAITTHAGDQSENPAPFQATLVDGSTLDVRDYRVVGQQVYLTLWSGTMLAFNKEEVTIQKRYVRDGQEHLTAVDDDTQHPRITHVPDNLGEYATGLNLHTEFLSTESESVEIKTDDVDQFHTEGGENPAKAAAQSDRVYEEYKRYIDGVYKRILESYVGGERVNRSSGDLANHGGSPTVRKPYRAFPDDPTTENDESNDQPLGFFGSMTIHAMYLGSNNQYALDADVVGSSLERLYFVKGGWVDFYDCQLAGDFSGICVDENGNQWTFLGPWN